MQVTICTELPEELMNELCKLLDDTRNSPNPEQIPPSPFPAITVPPSQLWKHIAATLSGGPVTASFIVRNETIDVWSVCSIGREAVLFKSRPSEYS